MTVRAVGLPGEGEAPRRAAPSLGVRRRLLLVTLLAVGAAIGLRLVRLQVVDHEPLARMARAQAQSVEEIPGPRGDIVDRHGRLLAISTPVRVLAIVPRLVSDRGLRELARASRCGCDLRRHRERAWRIVQRRCDARCVAAVEELVERGIVPRGAVHWERAYKREYPLGELAAQTLGFVTRDPGALEGLELAYNDLLRSPARRIVLVRDAKNQGVAVLGGPRTDRAPAALMLTLDVRIQRVLERALDSAMARHGAESGAGVVLDPRSGDLLALASRPAFDPNRYWKARDEALLNRPLRGEFEPGSVIKPLVAAALVEGGFYRPGRRVDCEHGAWRTRGRTIHDVHGWGALTLPEVLAVSSNIGITKFARPLPDTALYGHLAALGLGRRTGVDLQGESPGRLPRPGRVARIDRDSNAFGYSLSVTPLQLAVAYATIAADGLRPVPHLARAVRRDGDRWAPLPVPAPQRALSPSTAALLRRWLVGVVEDRHGTGSRARVPGFRVAGKTGTAWHHDPERGGYDRDRLHATFAGFAPAEQPRVVVVVSLLVPRRSNEGGGTVAAPVFAEVMGETLRLLRVDAPVRVRRQTPDDGPRRIAARSAR
ncbi:MAG: penicillin-binding protein 2 [Acidobacteria bacterium]|nr:MAG: penicillin-binding protein 2 [Acidobacteriota bacterium]